MSLTSVLKTVARVGRQVGQVHCCSRVMYSTDHNNRFYTKKHEWVSVTDNIGTIGISSFAQEALGEVVFAQLPDVGKQLAAGEECGALESVKAAGEVYSPVSGTVTDKNSAVESTPSLINKACYTDGWLFRVKLTSSDELNKLMDQAAYDKYVEESH